MNRKEKLMALGPVELKKRIAMLNDYRWGIMRSGEVSFAASEELDKVETQLAEGKAILRELETGSP